MYTSELIVRITRGEITESQHRGHIAVADTGGRVPFFAGNPRIVTFARSAAKLIQAIPVIESGAADHFRLTEEEIALICASHNGEYGHIRTALSILGKVGFGISDLQCGSHYPFHPGSAKALKQIHQTPGSLHNNCSGKHAGMLALCAQMNVPSDDYLSIGHPVQQAMLQTVSEMCGLSPDEIRLGIDGCGVPVFGMPIASLALAYSRLARPDKLPPERAEACHRILAAIRANPFHLAGSGRYDTRLIEATGGRIIGKMGAEAIYALAVPEQGWGIVVKVEDGSVRALYAAVMETLVQLQLLSEKEYAQLEEFHRPPVRNWQGKEVGRTEPDFTLRRGE